MSTLSELIDAPAKILSFGSSGTGKTLFWATLGDKAELLECDPNGYTSLKYFKDEWTETRQKIHITYFTEPAYNSSLCWGLLKNRVIAIGNALVTKTYPHKVVIFDTLTSMGDFALRSVKAGKGLFSTATTQGEWGLAMTELEQVITMARAWPIPVVFLGHEQATETDSITTKVPSIIGNKLLPKILQYMEEIYYATVVPLGEGKQKFCFQTVRSPGVDVKSRRCLPNHFDMRLGAEKLFESINQKLS